MEKSKEFVKNRFNEDIKQLESLPNEKLFFSEDPTERHITNIKEAFTDIFEGIRTELDVVELFTIQKGNKKINDFAIISNGLYYLCPNLLNGNCKLSHRCYGSKNERFQGVIKSRLKNWIWFAFLEYWLENDWHKYKTILYWSIDRNADKFTDVVRINQQSDFRNDAQLFIFGNMLRYVRKHHNSKTRFYAYSKSKMDFGLFCEENFLVNESVIIDNQEDLDLFALTKPHYKNMYYLCLMSKDLDASQLSLKPCKNDCEKCRQCSQYFQGSSNAKFTYLH